LVRRHTQVLWKAPLRSRGGATVNYDLFYTKG
jgi:hypothetical protein